MPFAREQMQLEGKEGNQLVFVDDNPRNIFVNGHEVLTYAQFQKLETSARYVALAIADDSIRKRLAECIVADGGQLWQIIARHAVIMDNVELSEGAIISPFATLGSNARVGKCFHANVYSYVAHDCRIGDFVTFAPGVKCNGNVVIEDHVFVGAGAIIKQGTPDSPLIIGKNAVIGMGAVVTKSVAAGETVCGNPAVPLKR